MSQWPANQPLLASNNNSAQSPTVSISALFGVIERLAKFFRAEVRVIHDVTEHTAESRLACTVTGELGFCARSVTRFRPKDIQSPVQIHPSQKCCFCRRPI